MGEMEENVFEISQSQLTFPETSSSESVSIKTNLSWHIEGDVPEWIDYSISSTSDGYLLTVSVSENIELNPRNYDLCILCEELPEKQRIGIVQLSRKILSIAGDKVISVDGNSSDFQINIEHNVPYLMGSDSEWISFQSKNGDVEKFYSEDTQIVHIEKNTNLEKRIGIVILRNDSYGLVDTLHICQGVSTVEPSPASLDGQWHILQSSSIGSPVLVIMGDGFTEDMLGDGGEYDRAMEQTMEYFFSVEPYSSFRDYFNVYQVDVVSSQKGVGDHKTVVNNRLCSQYGDGSEITCSTEICKQYIQRVSLIPEDIPVTAIVVLNDTKYAGTTIEYMDGSSIALCPMSDKEAPYDFEGIVHHEAGGHGFGFLADEYIYNDTEFPDGDKQDLLEWQKHGYMMNLDTSETPNLWKDIIETGVYPEAGMYEGGGLYQKGVWRCEKNSCMNDNIPYFNVQSRRVIINRIMSMSGILYSFDDFLADDSKIRKSDDNWKTDNISSLRTVPNYLAHPVRKYESFLN